MYQATLRVDSHAALLNECPIESAFPAIKQVTDDEVEIAEKTGFANVN